MKKTVTLILAALLVISLASCKKNEPNNSLTTTVPLATAAQNDVTASVGDQQSQTDAAVKDNKEEVGLTYILTTQYGQTMPTVVTTLFNLASEIAAQTTAATEPNLNYTVPSMSAPVVVSQQIPTRTPSTAETTKKEAEKTEPEATTKAAAETERKYLDMNSQAIDSSGNIVLEFSLNDWDGGVKTRTLSNDIPVSYSGTSKRANALVKQSGNQIVMTIYTGTFNIPGGTVVNFEIPAGSISSKKGNQVNSSYSAGITTPADPDDEELADE